MLKVIPLRSRLMRGTRATSSISSGASRLRPLLPRAMSPVADADDSLPSMRVLTWNILGQSHISPEWYPAVPISDLQWPHRGSYILEHLLDVKPDVFALQEVEGTYFHSTIRTQLAQEGYWSTLKKRSGRRNEGTAIFWKSSKYRLKSSHEIEYNELATLRNDTSFSTDSVGIMGLFEEIESAASESPFSFVFAATHLWWNRRQGDIQLAQSKFLLQKVTSLATTPNGSLPVIICSFPNSAVHQSFLSSDLQLDSAYAGYRGAWKRDRGEPLFTQANPAGKSTVDYIFYNQNTWVPRRVLMLPNEKQMSDLGIISLPTPPGHEPSQFFWPSDHFSLAVDLVPKGLLPPQEFVEP